MTTYLYCLLTRSSPEHPGVPAGLRGIGGAPVRVLVHGDSQPEIEAWVATIDPALLKQPAAVTAQNALVHHAVVDAALATGRTPLPARYGQRFPDDDACLADLASRVSTVGPALARVAGLVEMALLLAPSTRRMLRELQTVSLHDIRADQAHAGRRYLEALRASAHAEERRDAFIDSIGDRLSAAVAPYAREERRQHFRRQASGAVMASLVHLLPRPDADAYRVAAQRVEPPAGFQIVVAGPRAPYSFSNDRGDPGMNLAD